MEYSTLTKSGKLRKRHLPAMYVDTSVLVEYWMTEGMEAANMVQDPPLEKLDSRVHQTVRDLLKSDKRIGKMTEVRKKLHFERVQVAPVVSPASLLEFMEWHAESGFKQVASEASNVMFIQKRSKKQLGHWLKKTLKWRRAEVKKLKRLGKSTSLSTGLGELMDATWLNSSFAYAHGFHGLLHVDIVNFNLTTLKAWQEPSAYAYLQLGLADVLHILFAQHLGCQYIASFDSDFVRVKDIIKEEAGISVLSTPEEILAVL